MRTFLDSPALGFGTLMSLGPDLPDSDRSSFRRTPGPDPKVRLPLPFSDHSNYVPVRT